MSYSKPFKYFLFSPAINTTPIPQINNIVHHPADNKDLVLVNNDIDARPTVVLLGWVGGQAKHLVKYVEMWNEKGFNCLYYPVPLLEFAFPYITLLFKITKVLRELQSYLKETNCKSLIFNIFSNGGGFMYGHFLRVLYSKSGLKEFELIRNSIRGCVFDSLPSVHWGVGVDVIKVAAPHKLGLILALLALPFIIPQWIAYCQSYYQILADRRNRWLHLFLYSKTDYFVSHKVVNRFIELLRKNITDPSPLPSNPSTSMIQSQCFEKSPHVLHLRVYPKEYHQKIDQFIKTLSNNRKSSTNETNNNRSKL